MLFTKYNINIRYSIFPKQTQIKLNEQNVNNESLEISLLTCIVWRVVDYAVLALHLFVNFLSIHYKFIIMTIRMDWFAKSFTH